MTPNEQDILRSNYRIRQFGALALVILSLFLLAGTLYVFKSLNYIGSGVAASNTISVSGSGDVFSVPDTATFDVTVMETAKDVTTAQTNATKKNNDIVAYLKSAGVEDKDIQTTDYSVNPQYEYTNGICTSGLCQPGKQTLVGFQVSQTLTVKVKDTTKAGDLLAGVGSKGASSVSGLTFTVEDEDALKAQARDKAIADAKGKADKLASSLGVHIVRVVGFSENAAQPVYYARAMAMDSAGSAAKAAPPSPEIPTGQNKITSDVTVTYEIR